jgi:hypothetical protein
MKPKAVDAICWLVIGFAVGVFLAASVWAMHG